MSNPKEKIAMGKDKAMQGPSNGGESLDKKAKPSSLIVAERGIKTSHDFADLMSALMSNLIEGTVAPNVGNATCNAGGKLLKVVEMQYKYGTSGKDGSPKTLVLSLRE
jgi:hypothetical protein